MRPSRDFCLAMLDGELALDRSASLGEDYILLIGADRAPHCHARQRQATREAGGAPRSARKLYKYALRLGEGDCHVCLYVSQRIANVAVTRSNKERFPQGLLSARVPVVVFQPSKMFAPRSPASPSRPKTSALPCVQGTGSYANVNPRDCSARGLVLVYRRKEIVIGTCAAFER